MKPYTKVALILILLVTSVATVLQAEPQEYESLRARYFRLRNTDPQVLQSQEWVDLAADFENFIDANNDSPQTPSALFNLAVLYEELFRNIGRRDALKLSLEALQRLARDYPGHYLSDDALVKFGDLRLDQFRDREGAARAYLEVVDSYPASDMRPVAEARLRTLRQKPNNAVQDVEPNEPRLLDIRRIPNETPPVAPRSLARPIIVLDPGHGGEDYGAVGVGGLMEKDVVLAVALRLESLLKKELGATVRLTRRSDVFVPLAERTNLANDFDADLFISLHANASPKGRLSGHQTFYLDNTGDKASRKLAERENASFHQEGTHDLEFILSDLIQNAKLDDSISLANYIQRSTVGVLGEQYSGIKDLGVRKAPFYVLVGAHMPCVLVEMFFIDNALDGGRLATAAFRADIAEALMAGIVRYLEKHDRQRNT